MAHSKKTIILSISSDIGYNLALRRLHAGATVCGSYRTSSQYIDDLSSQGAYLLQANFSEAASVDKLCSSIIASFGMWDELILAVGSLDPIGYFPDINIDDWMLSFNTNFTNQIRSVHNLLSHSRQDSTVLFFAGSGTNGPADCFSAYTASKVSLIKMTELLDSEIKNTKFVIMGPGWIKTKIHQQTLLAKSNAGISYLQTLNRISNNDFGEMNLVLDCIDWICSQPKKVVGGRNICAQHDMWSGNIIKTLISDSSAGKLRRYRNFDLNSPDTNY